MSCFPHHLGGRLTRRHCTPPIGAWKNHSDRWTFTPNVSEREDHIRGRRTSKRQTPMSQDVQLDEIVDNSNPKMGPTAVVTKTAKLRQIHGLRAAPERVF